MFRLLLVILGFTYLGLRLVAERAVWDNRVGVSMATIVYGGAGLALVYFSGRARWFLLLVAVTFTFFGVLLYREEIFRRGYGAVSWETRCVFAFGMALAVAYLVARPSRKKHQETQARAA